MFEYDFTNPDVRATFDGVVKDQFGIQESMFPEGYDYTDPKVAEAANTALFDYFSNFDQPAEAAPVPEAEGRTWLGTAGDVLVSGAKGVVGLGEAAVGLADIPTLGRAGKFAEEYLGYEPKVTQDYLSSLYSSAQQDANAKVEDARGFVDSATAMVKNPSTIGHSIVESLPVMFGGAAAGRALLATGAKVAPWVASALGEGLAGMGSSAEQTRQQTEDGVLTPKQAAISIGSGAGTAAFGMAGGRVAQKLGIADIDTMLVQSGSNVTAKGAIKRIISGGITEGAFEELPQSVQEQLWQNAAMDRPLLEGVPESAAKGLLTGMVMGAGANIIAKKKDTEAPPPETDTTTPDTTTPTTEELDVEEVAEEIADFEDMIAKEIFTTEALRTFIDDIKDKEPARAKQIEEAFFPDAVIKEDVKPEKTEAPQPKAPEAETVGTVTEQLEAAEAKAGTVGTVTEQLEAAEAKKPSPYFNEKEGSETMALKDILPREPITSKESKAKLARGIEKMKAAKEGTGTKRDPISVYKRADGKMVVIDGNTTYHMLQEMGETDVPVQVKKTLKQLEKTLDEIYKKAEESRAPVKKMTQDVAKEFKGTAHFRPKNQLKARKRAQEKVEIYGTAQKLKDIIASTVSFKTEAQMRKALDAFLKSRAVLELKDNFKSPMSSGYRDVSMTVQLPNGHLFEIQFTTDVMLSAKNDAGHVIYDVYRELRPLKNKFPEAEKIYTELERISKEYYDKAYASASSIALSSDMVEALANISTALGESSIATRLDPSNLKSLSALSSQAKETPSDSTKISDIKSPPPGTDTVTPEGEEVKKKKRISEEDSTTLKDLGYTKGQIKKMKAADATAIIESASAEAGATDKVKAKTKKLIEKVSTHIAPRGFKALIESGKIKFVSREEFKRVFKGRIPEGAELDTEGVYDKKTKTSYLVVENLTEDTVWGVVRHELGVHGGLDGLLGAQKDAILRRVDTLVEEGDAAMLQAQARAKAAETPEGSLTEETLAYFVADAKNVDHNLYERILKAVRRWAFKAGVKLDMTPQELSELIDGAISREADLQFSKINRMAQGTIEPGSSEYTAGKKTLAEASENLLFSYNKKKVSAAIEGNALSEASVKIAEGINVFTVLDTELQAELVKNSTAWEKNGKKILGPVSKRTGKKGEYGVTKDMRPSWFNIQKAFETNPKLKKKVIAAGKEYGGNLFDKNGDFISHPIEHRTKPAKKDISERGFTVLPKFGGFRRSITQTFLDNMYVDREGIRSDINRYIEKIYKSGERADLLQVGLKTIGDAGGYKIPSAVRSADKTVAAVNLNSMCPMFMIGAHGCYFDGCYVTGALGAGPSGTNFYSSAMYLGEILQLSDGAIKTLNKAGGLRMNGSGDTVIEQLPQWSDIFKHAQMRGLTMKVISKQDATFEIIDALQKSDDKQVAKKASEIVVQPTVDPYWVAATEDDYAGAAAQMYGAGKKEKGKRLSRDLIKFYRDAGRDARMIGGEVYRKYGFSWDQINKLSKKYPGVKVQPRLVVGTYKEIAEYALKTPEILQTWMHASIRPGMYSEVEGKVLGLKETGFKSTKGKSEVGNFDARIAVQKVDGVWRILAQVKRGQLDTKTKELYTELENYIKDNYNKLQQGKIFGTLAGQIGKDPSALCCSISATVDECLSCTSSCHMGTFYTGNKLRDISGRGQELAVFDDDIMFSKVTDKKLINKLESGKKVKAFRAMQLIDGKIYPPMSAKVKGELREPTEIGQWEQAEENPELAKDGKFKLDKANKSAIAARYNPYFHTSASPLNDQFSSAYKRPNLITVEVEIPASELSGDYKAEGAKDSTGEKKWNTGPVSSKLPTGKKRTVILSRWAKVTRVVPDSEVAASVAKLLKGEGLSVPDNVVTPSLRKELKKKGVKIAGSRYTDKIMFSKSETSKEFKKWSRGHDIIKGAAISNAKPGKGYVFRAYHGTTNIIEEFDPKVKGTVEGFFGQVSYFTSSEADATGNYAGVGPDLARRIDDLSEKFSDMEVEEFEEWLSQNGFDPDMADATKDSISALEQIATEYLQGPIETTMDLYVRLDNPVFVGGKNRQWVEVVEPLDEYIQEAKGEGITDEGEIDDRAWELRSYAEVDNPVVEALATAIGDSNADIVGSPMTYANKVWQETGIYEEEVSAQELLEKLQASDEIMYMDLEDGQQVGYHIIGQMFKNLGFDGIVLQDADKTFPSMNMEQGTSHIHVFAETPSQIKDVANEAPTDAPGIMFSKTTGVSPETDKFFGRQKTTLDKIVEAATNEPMRRFKKWAITNGMDRLDPVKVLGNEAYMLHRMMGNMASQMASFLQYGKFKWEGNALSVDKDPQGGFLKWYGRLKDDGPKFLQWVAAKRAEELSQPILPKGWDSMTPEQQKAAVKKGDAFPNGRENFLTKDRRDLIFEKTWPADDTRALALNKEFQEFNNNILDIAEEAGIVNAEARKEWEQQFYIPFYRLIGEEEKITDEMVLTSPSKIRRHIKSGIKQLKGAEAQLGDPMENIIQNWSHLVNESMRNQSRSHAFQAGKAMGMMKRVPMSFLKMSDKTTLSFMDKGKPVYFQTADAELFNALSEFNHEHLDGVMSQFFGKAKSALTWGVTIGPAFRVANAIRDTLSTGVNSPHFTPFIDSFRGAFKVVTQHPDYISYAGSGGAFTQGFVRGHDPEAQAQAIMKMGKKTNVIRKIYDAWQYVGDVSEMAARVQLYSNLKKKGASQLTAAYEAKDIMDFTMKGAGKAMTTLTNMIPFMNARIQGLYRLGRGAKEHPVSFLAKGSMLTIASMALWAKYKDDERYIELPDEQKFLYHHFWIGDNHIQIPKAFEVGLLFSSVFEEWGNIHNKTEEGKHIMTFMGHAFNETLAMNPMPQLIKPISEVLLNHNTFTGRPIEGMGMEKRSPGKRYDPWTPEAMKALGEKLNMSPKKAEHLVRGYFGAFGAGLIMSADLVYTNVVELPDRPSMPIGQYPLVGRFVKGDDVRRTKYGQRVWEMMDDLQEANADLNWYKKNARIKDARQFFKSEKTRLRAYERAKPYKKQLDTIRNQSFKLWTSKSLTTLEKDTRLKRMEKKKNVIQRRMYDDLSKMLKK